MRDGFKQIVDGWELDKEPVEIDARIRRAVLWSAADDGILPDEAVIISAMIEAGITLATRQIVDGYLRRAGIVSISVADDPRPLPELDLPNPFDEYRKRFGRRDATADAAKIIDGLLRLLPGGVYNAVDDALAWLRDNAGPELFLSVSTRERMESNRRDLG